MHILVIHGDVAETASLASALADEGFVVSVAADGYQGLTLLYEMLPDLVIASSEIPPVEGWEAFCRLRQASSVPILALARMEESVELLEMGADSCIIRPADTRELLARVRSLLRRSKKRKPWPKKRNPAIGCDGCRQGRTRARTAAMPWVEGR